MSTEAAPKGGHQRPGQGPQDHSLIPGQRLHPAEADLRLVVNTLPRERPHWWLYTPEGRRQREFLERLGWWAA
jgi:hypothetical protein